MGYAKYVYGEISSKSGSSVTYLPIIQRRKIERASPIADVRLPLSDLGHGESFHLAVALSTYQVLHRGLCDNHTSNENTTSV